MITSSEVGANNQDDSVVIIEETVEEGKVLTAHSSGRVQEIQEGGGGGKETQAGVGRVADVGVVPRVHDHA